MYDINTFIVTLFESVDYEMLARTHVSVRTSTFLKVRCGFRFVIGCGGGGACRLTRLFAKRYFRSWRMQLLFLMDTFIATA